MKNIFKIIIVILSFSLIFCLVSCRKIEQGLTLQSRDLMRSISVEKAKGKDVTDSYKTAVCDTSFKILKSVTSERNKQGKNTVMAPLATVETLIMFSNGATSKTLEQNEEILLKGISLENANEFNAKFLNGLKNSKAELNFANSVWINNGVYSSVKKEFLEKNAKYYGVDIYKSDFATDKLKADMSSWLSFNTEKAIDETVQSVNTEDIIYLLSAVNLDGKWRKAFNPADNFSGEFENYNGETAETEFMMCIEEGYIEDGYATGFVKEYEGGEYSFVALIPNEQISITDYINMIDGATFLNAVKSKKEGTAIVKIPKFSTTFETSLKDNCVLFGLDKIFSTTESNLDNFMKKDEMAHISEIYQKVSFAFDESGTFASKKASGKSSMEAAGDYEIITFDKPFFYAVIDNKTSLPLITGTVITF